MPKFIWGKVERVAGVFLHSIEREFVCRGKKYLLTVIPAIIKDRNGKEINLKNTQIGSFDSYNR